MPRAIESISQHRTAMPSTALALLPINKLYATYDVRVWREQEQAKDHYDNSDVDRVCESDDWRTFGGGLALLAAMISKLPRVNAVEVKDRTGNGIVIYTEWP